MSKDVFQTLQDGWYNGIVSGLGLSSSTFQILQPNPPIIEQSGDTVLWGYFNNIPPFSLTQQFAASGGNQFYSDYRALMSALEPSSSVDPETVIGQPAYDEWVAYVRGLSVFPSANQYPVMFRNWALLNAPGVANAGASAYAQVLLDPILTAQNVLLLSYTDENGLPEDPDWNLGYSDLVNQLKAAPSTQFDFDSTTENSDVSSSWTKGGNTGFFGLWGGSSSKSSISESFSENQVQVKSTIGHILTFSCTPGNWYNSGAIGLAFSSETGVPWSPNSAINWNNTFGDKGNMQRFAANIIVVADMDITITSDAVYSTSEQTEVHNNSHAGMWPFYSSGGGSSSSTSAKFSSEGHMTVSIQTDPVTPTVIGVNVLSAAEYLGHSVEAAKLQVKALKLAAL
ncbi:MAG: hypothetical protein ACJASQ_002554 [Crocinitomicaceae bacterium]|jgi:hypothetical protein